MGYTRNQIYGGKSQRGKYLTSLINVLSFRTSNFDLKLSEIALGIILCSKAWCPKLSHGDTHFSEVDRSA